VEDHDEKDEGDMAEGGTMKRKIAFLVSTAVEGTETIGISFEVSETIEINFEVDKPENSMDAAFDALRREMGGTSYSVLYWDWLDDEKKDEDER
jgi:hypothetical protein